MAEPEEGAPTATPYSIEFSSEYSRVTPPNRVLDAVKARTGVDHDPAWLEATLALALSHLRAVAPCKRDKWVEWYHLPDDVWRVVIESIIREYHNPHGYRSETIGDYSYQLGGDAGAWYLPPELSLIAAHAGCGSGTVYSIRSRRAEDDSLRIDAADTAAAILSDGYAGL
jgi:hypothetical protein